METTRHFVASVYVVNDGAVALHKHKKLDLWLAAGGHIDPKELPHEAAIRECEEEMGITPNLIDRGENYTSNWVDDVPSPADVLVEKIDECNGNTYHKHVDMIFFATADTRDIDPQGESEVAAEKWEWFTPEELREKTSHEKFPNDGIEIALDAIDVTQKI